MLRFTPIILVLTALLSCGGPKAPEAAPAQVVAEPDSMLHGLSCDGTNDSVIVFLPLDSVGADPVVYNIETAKAQHRIFGRPEIGDWVGVILNPEDSTEATMVIDLDQLKGTWTYEVRPTWKAASKMSRRALRRKMAELPDSLREAYMVPREYGFTLKRSSAASPVGYVMAQSSLTDDSPVEYPAVRNVTGWKCRNGRLILTVADAPLTTASGTARKPRERHYALDFVMMSEDSLVLDDEDGNRVSLHRKQNAMTVNDAARKAVEKTSRIKN